MIICIIGGGAAGFFAAITAKEKNPQAEVWLLEKSTKFLSKVKVSGGGRCNVTHACFSNKVLASHYPRGEAFLRKAFEQFNAADMLQWLEHRGVEVYTQEDGCVFPKSNDSQTIVDCLMQGAQIAGVKCQLQAGVQAIERQGKGFLLRGLEQTWACDRVIVCSGGQPKWSGMAWLQDLGHSLVPPVPSLFTFNMPQEPIRSLMGLVVEKTRVRIEGEKRMGLGPLLITHWGMSGPAILQLSALGARILAEKDYQFSILVDWLDGAKEPRVLETLSLACQGNKLLSNANPFSLPQRLWQYLLEKCGLDPAQRWNQLGQKGINKLSNTLLNDRYHVQGKTTFKEEFVTAGGLSLQDFDPERMESKICPGLFAAGEILDIDGLTGGFNFQAAWTSGYIAGSSASQAN